MGPSLCAQLPWAEPQVLGCCGSVGCNRSAHIAVVSLQDGLCCGDEGVCRLAGGSSPCLVAPLLTPLFFCLAGYYAVELVNDSLYDWNVKLLK